VQHISASLAKLFHRASSSTYRAARILAKLPNPLHEVHSNQGLISELMREEIIYEEAIRKERTRIARELDTPVQTFLSASMQLGVAADSLPSDLPVKPRLD
jgi:signal transduction histidine kinase